MGSGRRPGIGFVDVTGEAISPFRARVAILASTVTLFGAVVGWFQASSSREEDGAARAAAEAGIVGLRAQVEATSTFRRDLGIHVASTLVTASAARDAARARALGRAPELAFPLGEDAARLDEVGVELEALSPVVDDETTTARQAELEESADRARLEQLVASISSGRHGDKADAFVAVLALLAAVLAMLGLSLVVEQTARWVLVVPALVVLVAAVVATASIVRRDVGEVPERAVAAVAEGDRLLVEGDFDRALERFDDAVDASPGFAVALDRRSQASFLAGLPASGRDVASIPDDDALAAAIADARSAIDQGSIDPATTSNLGWFLFLDGDAEAAAELFRSAREASDDDAVVRFRLGTALLALDDEDAATEAFEEGLEIVDESRDLDRFSALAVARSDLQTLRSVYEPDDLGSAPAEIEGVLADFELRRRGPSADSSFVDDIVDGSPDASVVDIAMLPTPQSITPDIEVDGIEPGTPMAFLWFYRADDAQPFRQLDGEASFDRFDDPSTDIVAGVLDEGCLPAGEYLLELFVGDELIGGQSTSLERPLGDLEPLELTRMGTRLCVPEGWEVSVEDFSDVLAPRTILRGPEGESLSLSTSAIGAAADDRTEAELMDAGLSVAESLGTLIGGPEDGGPVGVVSFAGSLRLDDSRQQRVRVGDDEALAVVSVGPDRVTRVLLFQARSEEELDALVSELQPSITFRSADLQIDDS